MSAGADIAIATPSGHVDRAVPGVASPDFIQPLESMLGVPFTPGNDVRILQNGVEIFPAMIEAIDAARRRIEFLSYVYGDGKVAEQFAKALACRAAEGVLVRVLLDAFGARPIPERLLVEMQRAGVEIRWFRPLATWKFWRNDNRTHRKILVVDDQHGFTGGVGIADEWAGDARIPSEWRDTQVRITGPAVSGLRAAFLDNWNEAGDWCMDEALSTPGRLANGVPVQIVRGSSTYGWTSIATMIRSLISLSTRNLEVVTPYFVPDSRMVDMLCAAATRGVDVKILYSGRHTDVRLSRLAGQSRFATLLDAGVSLLRYQKTNLHAKLILVDGVLSCLGSANLNHRSMGKDEECCALVSSANVYDELHARFEEDCGHAELIDARKWEDRGFATRVAEFGARLLSSEL